MRRLGQLAGGALEAGWLATVILIPLFIDKAVSQVFEPAKAGLLCALALFTLVAWAVHALCAPDQRATTSAAHASKTAAWRLAMANPLTLAVLLVVLSTLLSTALSIAPAESFWGHHTRAQGALTLLAGVALFAALACNLSTPAQLRRLLTALILPSLPIAAYALFQRAGLEPLNVTSRETELERVTSLLGQPVFLAGYLGMVLPFTAQRAWAALSERGARRWPTLVSYGTLGLLQAAAALFTESRGPLLGIGAALAVAVLAWSARQRRRWAVVGLWAAGAALATLFAVGAPARLADDASAEQARMARRAAETFAVTGGGGQFRVTTWRVAQRLFQSSAPLEFADGERDSHAVARKVVGYGPEVQYAITPPFYDAELTQLFGYFVTDRFHNDLWDVLITTGALGLLAWLALQSALLWRLLGALELLYTRTRALCFWATYGAGMGSGALVALAMRGPSFVFLGLQCGAVLGVLLFLSGLAFAPSAQGDAPGAAGSTPKAAREAELVGVSLATLAALVSHWVETSFSFTVVTTGALFWALGALPFVITRLRSSATQQGAAVQAPPGHPLAEGALLGLAMGALGYAFLGNAEISRRPGAVLWDGLTALSQPAGERFPVVALLAAGTLLFGGWLLALESSREQRAPSLTARLTWLVASALVVALVYWLRVSFILAQLALPSPGADTLVSRILEIRSQATSSFYLLMVALMLGYAFAVTRGDPTRSLPAAGKLSAWRGWSAGACALLGVFSIIQCSLRPARADAAVAMGDAFKQQNQLALAEQAYERAAQLGPHREVYRSLLAKTYVARARADAGNAPRWLERADQTFVAALSANRIPGELAVNLAMTRGNRAQRASGGQRAALSAEAAVLYARALRLNPQDPAVWRAWAHAQLNLLQDPAGALKSAHTALPLDPRNPASHALLGDCKSKLARSQPEAQRKQTYLEAAEAYERARQLAPDQVSHRVNAGKAYLEADQPERALALLRTALASVPPRSRLGQTTAALVQRAQAALDPQAPARSAPTP